MKILILTCLLAGLLVAGADPRGRHKMKKMSKNLNSIIRGVMSNSEVTYCAWNNDTDSYETVTKSMKSFVQEIKSAKNKDLAPLHTGECGNCSQANICKEKFMARLGGKGRKMCGTDGKEYENRCEFAIARCEAYNKNQTKLLPKPCQMKKSTSKCEKLEAKCNDTTSSMNEKYCAWNKEKDDYETVTNLGKPCLVHLMKCRQEGDKLPLHKGECGNCSKENVCKRMNLKHISEMMGMNDVEDDGDDDENDGNTNVKVGKSGWGKKIKKRSKMGGKWSKMGRKWGKMAGKWSKNKFGKKGSKKMWRKICDEDGNEYNDFCEFTIARCTTFAKDGKELKRGSCQKNDD